jgi:DNA-binding transcriptional LysR family regulator
MGMNLRHMEVFRAVMHAGTVRGAAQILNVSEPAVSKLLAVAERRAGLRLFERVKGRIMPTPDARALYAEIEALWKGVERIRVTAQSLAKRTASNLWVAGTASLGTHLVPLVAAELYRTIPQLNLKVDMVPPVDVIKELLDDTADVGVALAPPAHPKVSVAARYSCSLVCVMPADHPLAKRRSVRRADLASQRIISISRTLGSLEQTLSGLKLDMAVRSGPLACWFARAGVGVAIVDEPTVAGGTFAGLVARPLAPSAKVDVLVLHNVERPLSGAAKAFQQVFDAVWKTQMRKFTGKR